MSNISHGLRNVALDLRARTDYWRPLAHEFHLEGLSHGALELVRTTRWFH